jgi:protein-L-isoaspartate(D-aspartate) O-methyltransferase
MNKKDLIRSLSEKDFPKKIVEAFEYSDRSKFIPRQFRKNPYADIPFSIGYGQTTSQPYTIAFMLTLLDVKENQKILEVGSGSGYVLDLLSYICEKGKIFGVERIEALANRSARKLKDKKNVTVVHADGFRGLEGEAPFDRILVSATCENIPQNLLSQLKIKGRLVAPVGESVVLVKKDSGMNKVQEYPGFVFVPLIRGKK